MVRQFLVSSAQKDALAAVARGCGAQIISRVFSAGDLERIKMPMLLAFDDGRGMELTPDLLQSLRRNHRGGVRYSPAVVFCKTPAAVKEWRDAGAVALMRGADRKEIENAVDEALAGERAWITSAAYVGPCRRKHKAVLKWRTRRQQDLSAADKVAKKKSDAPVHVSSLDVLHRRLTLGATLLSGATIENRRAFRDLTNEFQVSANHHRRDDLHALIAHLRKEAEAFVQNGQREGAALEQIVREIGRHLGR